MNKGCAGILTTNSHWLVLFLQFSCSPSLKHSCLPDPDTISVHMSSCRYALYIFYFTVFVHFTDKTFWLRLTSVARYFIGYKTMMRSLAESKSRIGHSTCPRLQISMAICGIKKNISFFLRLGTYSSCFVHCHSWSLLVASVVYGIITDRVLKEERLGHTHAVRNKARFVTDPSFSWTSSSCVLPQVAVVGLFHLKD